MPWSARQVVSSRGKRADLAVVRRDRLHTTPAGGADALSELVHAPPPKLMRVSDL